MGPFFTSSAFLLRLGAPVNQADGYLEIFARGSALLEKREHSKEYVLSAVETKNLVLVFLRNTFYIFALLGSIFEYNTNVYFTKMSKC